MSKLKYWCFRAKTICLFIFQRTNYLFISKFLTCRKLACRSSLFYKYFKSLTQQKASQKQSAKVYASEITSKFFKDIKQSNIVVTQQLSQQLFNISRSLCKKCYEIIYETLQVILCMKKFSTSFIDKTFVFNK